MSTSQHKHHIVSKFVSLELIAKRYRGVLKKLWDIYDADRNGELDPEESKKLMQGFFKVQMNNFKIHSRDQFLRAATSVIPPEIPGYEQVVTKITKHADKIPELLEKVKKLNAMFSMFIVKHRANCRCFRNT